MISTRAVDLTADTYVYWYEVIWVSESRSLPVSWLRILAFPGLSAHYTACPRMSITYVGTIQIAEKIDARAEWHNAQVLLPDQSFLTNAEIYPSVALLGYLNRH